MISGHIGCQGEGGNIGRPKTLLEDVSTDCKTGGPECVELGKRACDATSNCWGFGIHNVSDSWGVQVYDTNALNPSKCDGTYGLGKNKNWSVFKKVCGKFTLFKNLFIEVV